MLPFSSFIRYLLCSAFYWLLESFMENPVNPNFLRRITRITILRVFSYNIKGDPCILYFVFLQFLCWSSNSHPQFFRNHSGNTGKCWIGSTRQRQVWADPTADWNTRPPKRLFNRLKIEGCKLPRKWSKSTLKLKWTKCLIQRINLTPMLFADQDYKIRFGVKLHIICYLTSKRIL